MKAQNPTFIPGPTNLPETLRKAVDIATVDHRSPAFGEILRPALKGVKAVLATITAEVILFPSTATGAWESSITNLLSPGDRVLAGRYGVFSQRWIDMCRRHGLTVDAVETQWGEGAPADRFRDILEKDTAFEIKAVLVTHNETATGVASDVAAVRSVLNDLNHPALLLVDGVSSIASMDFRMDEWGVDVAIVGSQKGFMLAAGLAIAAFSPKAMACVSSAKLPRCYFDIRDMLGSYNADTYPYTPPVSLINGLKVATEILLDEGMPQVYERHNRLAGLWGQGGRPGLGS